MADEVDDHLDESDLADDSVDVSGVDTAEDSSADPLADDPAFAAWPADVRQAWVDLRLPSLHELLQGQERLAAEIRRQNNELRKLAAVAGPSDPGAGLAAALTEARELGERLARASSATLIALVESVDRHAEALATTVAACAAQPAARGWLGQRIPWSTAQMAALTAQVAGARLVRDKTRQALADAGLVPIAPDVGATFDPLLHQCVDTAIGAAGCIVRVVREGWRSGAAVVRSAEVVVGRS